MLISDEYRALQAETHEEHGYGRSGWKHAALVKKKGYKRILDYGCGKALLEVALGFPVVNYDPAIPHFADNNVARDFVYCGDVLEHIEPECLDDVLKDIKRCMKIEGIFVVHTGPANRILSDGRNAHIIQKDSEWWCNKVSEFFIVDKMEVSPKEVVFNVRPK